MHMNKLGLFAIFCTHFISANAELLTAGLLGIAAGGIISMVYQGKCHVMECCTDKYIPYDTNDLARKMKSSFFGQPLANEVLFILEGHRDSVQRNEATKALAIAMYGWPGTGKTYLSQLIAESLFTNGMKSDYVKLYHGRNDFPNVHRVPQYQEKLKQDLKQIVSNCGKALIIFEEVNDIPPQTLDVLKPYLDLHYSIDGIDYRNVIFLFIANTNGQAIAEHFIKLKKVRNSLELADFEPMLRKGSVDTEGGFEGSKLIFSQLIDHYIPFIPLEEVHVEKCARAEFKNVGISYPSKKMIEYVMSHITYGPPNNPIFANAGCKRIRNQVSYIKTTV